MSENYAISLKRSTALLAALTFMAMLTVVNLASFFSGKASAATLEERSLTLSSTLLGTETEGNQGDPTNGSDAVYEIEYDASGVSVESVQLEFCDDPLDIPCTSPVGIDVSTATITSTTYANISAAGTNSAYQRGFTFDANTTTTDVDITLTGVQNPTELGTFFVRITTFSDDDTTTPVDDGNVASAITEGIFITARVKETLGFSTGAATEDNTDILTGGIVAPGGSCDPITSSGAMTLGDPTENALSLNATYYNYSAFRTYTNAGNGMIVTYEGNTLESGSNNIDEIGAAAAAVNVAGSDEQFGLAIDNTATSATQVANSVSTTLDMQHVSAATAYSGDPGELTITPAYAGGAGDVETATPQFAFQSGAPRTIADSNGNYVDCVTVPVRYIANIEPLTAPGVYTTTIVYTAVPTY